MIQKYEAFKMDYEEIVKNVFSRFQTIVAGLKVMDKGYSTIDHVKKTSEVYLSVEDLW